MNQEDLNAIRLVVREEIKDLQENVDILNTRIKGMEERQDEMYNILKGNRRI